MKLIIFGASGRTGSALLERVLSGEHGSHEVTAFVRDSARLSNADPRLRIVQGDAQSDAAVALALNGQDIVLSTLGGADLAANTQNIIQAMTRSGVKRLAVTLSIGVLLPSVEPQYVVVAKQHQQILDTLRGSTLEWIAACPPSITPQPRTGHYRATADRPSEGMTISRYDLADFLLDAALSDTYLREPVGVSN